MSTETMVGVADSELKAEAVTLRERADKCTITCNGDYLQVADNLKSIKGVTKKAIEFFKPMKQQADAMKKAILERERMVLDPLGYAEARFKAKMKEWDDKREADRRAEEARLQELARRQAEKDAEKLARKAEKAGDTETAEALRSAPVAVSPVVLQKDTPQVAGISYRDNWKFRIVNAALIPREYLIPNEVAIGQVARALKDQTQIPGVEVYNERVVATRG